MWRCYRGGLLLERLLGAPEPADGSLPEAWLASGTRARNGQHSQGPDEGISRVRGQDGAPGPRLTELLNEAVRPALLCKLLDSAIRLPIQCHPDRELASALYSSEHGKTEVWIVLGTRTINGEDPYLLLGFVPGVTREAFGEAIERQDVAAMEAMLHRVPVRAGDAYLVPGRLPHALGPGVLALEVQEPTDWVVQPERRVGEVALTHGDMWGPLEPDAGLGVFDYAGPGDLEAILERTRLHWREAHREPGGAVERLDGPWGEVRFVIERVSVRESLELSPASTPRVAAVLQGAGTLEHRGDAYELRPGESLVLSEGAGPLLLRAATSLVLVLAAAA